MKGLRYIIIIIIFFLKSSKCKKTALKCVKPREFKKNNFHLNILPKFLLGLVCVRIRKFLQLGLRHNATNNQFNFRFLVINLYHKQSAIDLHTSILIFFYLCFHIQPQIIDNVHRTIMSSYIVKTQSAIYSSHCPQLKGFQIKNDKRTKYHLLCYTTLNNIIIIVVNDVENNNSFHIQCLYLSPLYLRNIPLRLPL